MNEKSVCPFLEQLWMIYFSNFVHCLLICVPVTLVRLCFVPSSTLNWNINRNNINQPTNQLLLLELQQWTINRIRFCVCVLVHEFVLRVSSSSKHFFKIRNLNFATRIVNVIKTSARVHAPKTKQKPNPFRVGVGSVASSGTLLCRGKSLWMMKIVLKPPPKKHPHLMAVPSRNKDTQRYWFCSADRIYLFFSSQFFSIASWDDLRWSIRKFLVKGIIYHCSAVMICLSFKAFMKIMINQLHLISYVELHYKNHPPNTPNRFYYCIRRWVATLI